MIIVELAQAAGGVGAMEGAGIIGGVIVALRLVERFYLDPRKEKKNGNGGGSGSGGVLLTEHQADEMQRTYRRVGDMEKKVTEVHTSVRDPDRGMIVALHAINAGIREVVVELQKGNGKAKG